MKSPNAAIVRIPQRLSNRELLAFLESHEAWMIEKSQVLRLRMQSKKILNIPEYDALTKSEKDQIKFKFQEKVAFWQKHMQVTVSRITIRNQKTRWGSCSSKGNLNFNYRLYYMPEELMDYVVIHELAHRKHMNHSRYFWEEVGRYCPNYRAVVQQLRTYQTR